MTQLTANVWGSVTRYVQSWLLPSALAVGFFWVALLRAVDNRAPWSGLREANATLAFAVATGLVSFALASTARTLTRVLEGYLLPRWLRERWAAKQRQRRADLRRQIAAGDDTTALRLRVRLNRYPRSPELVVPTRFGNIWRAGETYGKSQYGLSTVDLWTQLVAVAGATINDALDEARAVVNFFVGAMWLSGFLSISAVVVAVLGHDNHYLLWIIPLVVAQPVWYRLSFDAITRLAHGYAAIADIGREPLAKALGVRLSGNLDEERALWEAISEYAAWGPHWTGTPTWIASINASLQARGASSTEDR